MKKLVLLMYWVVFFTVNLKAQHYDFTEMAVFQLDSIGTREETIARVFAEEVQKRTGNRPEMVSGISKKPTLVLVKLDQVKWLPEAYRQVLDTLYLPSKESFALLTDPNGPTSYIVGKDDRGLLFGVGRWLRKMEWEKGKLEIPANLQIKSAPFYPIRGHQLGYRPKTNAYDAFTVERFEQYIRELALFGANSIEIVPPRTDDDFSSRHMELPAIEMIAEQSRIADELDMDVWIWYPNMGSDYNHPDSVKAELEERHQVFAALPRLDHLFVPGGDPGELNPDALFNWLDQSAAVLHQYHPDAKIWVSPQVFRPTQAWFDRFFYHINQDYDWMGGVVFGPWVKIPLPEIRKLVKSNLPIRRYPDITHSLSSQYPVPNWDLSLAMTLGRECINPRPRDQKAIHNALAPFANGSLSYSEGTNDDVNKFIWTDQDWDPETPVIETLRDYARFFMGSKWTEGVAQGLLAQEENWRGPLLTNTQVPQTLMQWQEMESKAGPGLMGNFRFQMGLIRAYFDAYVQSKLVLQTSAEWRAKALLRKAFLDRNTGLIRDALGILESAVHAPVDENWKKRCLELAEALYQSIGAQLTISPHGAAAGRGNFIDNLDAVLNDAPWLMDQLKALLLLTDAKDQWNNLDLLLQRNNPGPGGFYDNFGEPGSWKRVVVGKSREEDPGSLAGPRIAFGVGLAGTEWVHEVRAVGFEGRATPRSWMMQANTLYDTPLKIKYENLDPHQVYTLNVAYTGRFRSRMKLVVDGNRQVHDFIQTGLQPIYSFELPKQAHQNGELTLTWTCGEGERGPQVAEIWLIPKNPSSQ
jgi:hypothetical protein